RAVERHHRRAVGRDRARGHDDVERLERARYPRRRGVDDDGALRRGELEAEVERRAVDRAGAGHRGRQVVCLEGVLHADSTLPEPMCEGDHVPGARKMFGARTTLSCVANDRWKVEKSVARLSSSCRVATSTLLVSAVLKAV